jgi:hypothetical protein
LRRKKRYLKEQLQLVDETLEPVVEDEITIFQNQYKATILLSLGLKRSDASISKIHRIVILSRKLNEEESKYFEQLKLSLKPLKLGLMQSLLFQIKIIMIHWLR